MPERIEGPILGFDFGLRRTGVAVGETTTGSSRPLRTLACSNGQPDWQEVANLLSEWQPSALVVGIPGLHRDEPQAVTEAAERFARRLEGRFRLPVHRVDEELSSHEAETRLKNRGRRGDKLRRDKALIDSAAAAIILETWLAEQ